MEQTVSGMIQYNDKMYPFLLEQQVVRIIGIPFQYYEDFKDSTYQETICGVTSDNRDILFLRCTFNTSFPFANVSFSTIGYIISSGNVGDPCDFTYEKLSFFSDAINSFFPPQKSMAVNADLQTWDGKMEITFAPFRENTVSFVYKNANCVLNIARNIVMLRGQSDIGKINSEFAFEYMDTQEAVELPDTWLALYDFLTFINYGRNVVFDKIVLYKRQTDGRFKRNAEAFIYSEHENYKPRPSHKAITIDDFPEEKIGTIFAKIAGLRGKDSRLAYYYPEKNSDDRRIDPERWLMAAIVFDGLFEVCYPDYKQNKKAQFREAKQHALEALTAVDKSAMSSSVKEYFEDCCKQVERYEGLLVEKFNHVLNEYNIVLKKILEWNKIDNSAYGRIYAEYRNKIAHGTIDPLGLNEVAVYRAMRAMIYLLLLKDIELSNEILSQIINKLFLR